MTYGKQNEKGNISFCKTKYVCVHGLNHQHSKNHTCEWTNISVKDGQYMMKSRNVDVYRSHWQTHEHKKTPVPYMALLFLGRGIGGSRVPLNSTFNFILVHKDYNNMTFHSQKNISHLYSFSSFGSHAWSVYFQFSSLPDLPFFIVFLVFTFPVFTIS